MRGWGGLEGLDLTDLADRAFVDRFWAKTKRQGRCRVWVGLKGNLKPRHGRYPQCQLPDGRIVLAHQVAYALTHDNVLPPDRILRSSCTTAGCVIHRDALTTFEAARSKVRASSKVPVEAIRAMRTAGEGCAAIAHNFPSVSHSQVRCVINNRTFADPTFEPVRFPERYEHPRRVSQEMYEEIREEAAQGTSINKIAKWSDLPLTTVWEIVRGYNSAIARRPVRAQ